MAKPDPVSSLVALIAGGMVGRDSLAKDIEAALDGIFGHRYAARSSSAKRVALAADVAFAGLLHEESPASGVYGGMSLIWFPVPPDGDGHPAASLLTLVCGTRGLSPDEQILGRPGHRRHLEALRRHLAKTCSIPMWAKQDPSNTALHMPRIMTDRYARFKEVLDRYGQYIYAAAAVPSDPAAARAVVCGFLDLYAWERGWVPLKAAQAEVEALRNSLRAELFPKVDRARVVSLLHERRFVILQGPPGTGKTRMADAILREDFEGCGKTVQFHPAVTYETFVSGIAPDVAQDALSFRVKSGWLLAAIAEAQASPRPYLLHIDEINRADLGRVLGEAIYLFEAGEINAGRARSVDLPSRPAGWPDPVRMPPNLYVLGTMNSADRSIAILDLAVRRRFAFVDIWPDLSVVEEQEFPLAIAAFGRLQDIFAEFSPPNALVLMPGHTYFLARTEQELHNRLRYELVPLIHEYLVEGRLGPCETELHAYLDWLEGELTPGGESVRGNP
ncbi:MAG TPA: restriction endonuclease [Clostridiales bacterium UBA8153]|nr:restriction endonuclease [Clostridiales bacterium UBA8153]